MAPLHFEELGPYNKGPTTPTLVSGTASPSCSPVFSDLSLAQLDISPLFPVVLLEKVDYSLVDSLAPPDNPKCSCSDDSPVLLDNSHCLSEDSAVLLEKPGLDVKKSFDDLSTLLSKLFIVGEAHGEAYDTYGLKGSLLQRMCRPHPVLLWIIQVLVLPWNCLQTKGWCQLVPFLVMGHQ